MVFHRFSCNSNPFFFSVSILAWCLYVLLVYIFFPDRIIISLATSFCSAHCSFLVLPGRIEWRMKWQRKKRTPGNKWLVFLFLFFYSVSFCMHKYKMFIIITIRVIATAKQQKIQICTFFLLSIHAKPEPQHSSNINQHYYSPYHSASGPSPHCRYHKIMFCSMHARMNQNEMDINVKGKGWMSRWIDWKEWATNMQSKKI